MFKFVSAVALSVAVLCLNARGAISIIPPNSIQPDTAMVIHIEAARFTPDLLKASAKAVLGANARIADEPLAKFKQNYDRAIEAGVTAMTLVVFEDRGPRPPLIAYFRTKTDADPDAIKKAIEATFSEADRASIAIEPQGHYITLRDKGVAFAAAGDPARTDLFAEALAKVGDAAVQIAFIPTDNMKKQMAAGGAPIKGLDEAAAAIVKAKFTMFAIKLGEAPNILITANLDNDETVKKLTDALNLAFDELKKKAAAPDAGPMAAIAPLIDGMRPSASGNDLRINIATPALAQMSGTFGEFFGVRVEPVAPQPIAPPPAK